MLSAIIDQQMKRMQQFYTAARGSFLEPGDPVLPLLHAVQSEELTER
jgi:hypothetical protein